MEYKHYVLSASVAFYTVEIPKWKELCDFLSFVWEVDNDTAMQVVHSEISYGEEGGNFYVCIQNNDLHQMIRDCMTFAVLKEKMKTF